MPLQKTRFALLLILFSLGFYNVKADGKGSSELTLGLGIVTPEQLYVVTSSAYASIPFAFTSAIFLNYRYFLNDYLAIGIGIGVDNVKGDLTYGNPRNNINYLEGTIGTYIQNTFTIAVPEVYIKYWKGKHCTLYGTAGIGYTFSRLEKAYDATVYNRYYYNGQIQSSYGRGPYDMPAVNPYYKNDNYLNGQLTFFGIRREAKIAWFIEFGYGYKGLIHTGLSLHL